MVRDIFINKVYLGKIEWGKYAQNKKNKKKSGPRLVKNDPSKVIVVNGKHEGFIAQEDYNPVLEKLAANRHQIPSRQEMLAFISRLKKAGIHATIRKPRGQDVSAACGQLRWISKRDNEHFKNS